MITRRGAISGLSLAATLGALPMRAHASAPSAEVIARTRSGLIRGTRTSGVATFKGIAYAGSTSGRGRFLPCPPPTPWTGTRDTIQFGPMAMQLPAYPTAEDLPASGSFWSALIGPQPAESEDCLSLNIWSPGLRDGRDRPVMVWFHGGAYLRGAASWAVYDGANLARDHDLVIVTINHRLNAFGFLDLSSFDPRYEGSGNAGLLDLVTALRWVRDHAEEFGGNPDNVTIFGESGGAGKVGALMAMPAARGLFHKAIMQSGDGAACTSDQAAEISALFLEKLGLDKGNVRKICDIPASVLRQQGLDLLRNAGRDGLIWPLNIWRPVIDGNTIPHNPKEHLGDGDAAHIPLLIGTNAFELTTLAFYLGLGNDEIEKVRGISDGELQDRIVRFSGYEAGTVARLIDLYRANYTGESSYDLLFRIGTDLQMRCRVIDAVERRVPQASAPTYMYRLDWALPARGGIWKSPHGLDVPLVFKTATSFPALFDDNAEVDRLMNEMAGSWASFARTGTPTLARRRTWPAYNIKSRKTMLIDRSSGVAEDPGGAERGFIATLPKLKR